MSSKKEKGFVYKEISLDLILEPEGRLRFEINDEDLEGLARSIESMGLRQAIEVVKRNDKYEIVYGERRFLAHKALGRDKIWAKVSELNDEQVAEIRAMENIARTNLSPIEEAAAFEDLKTRFNMTVQAVAKKVGRSFSNVKRRLDLLKMDKGIQKAVHSGKIKVSLAEELWRCTDEGHREYLLEMAIEHGVTKDVLRQWVNDYMATKRATEVTGEDAGGYGSVLDQKPIYQACDICEEAVKIEEVRHLGICKACGRKISNAKNQ